MQRQDAFFRLAAPLRGALRQGPADDGGGGEHASPTCNSPKAYRVPFQYSRLVREHLGTGAFMRILGRRHRHRCRRQRVLRPDRLLRRQHLRQRFLQGVHRRRPRSARMRSAPCSAPTIPSSPTTCGGCARFPASTKSRSTCPAPKRSCRRCGWRATTPGARIWFASPAPITAGGATCSPASAIRCRRTRPIRWPRCRSGRCMCCARAATSPACWSIRCRRCTRTATRPAIPRWSTARARAQFDRAAYTDWLKKLREVCTERGIVLIFDEVFVGFRLAAGGAQEYFGVRADMVTYGKSLAGGLPVGVVCGAQGPDAPLPRRPSRRRLLRPRHLQLASLRHDGDGRIPQPARQPELQRRL